MSDVDRDAALREKQMLEIESKKENVNLQRVLAYPTPIVKQVLDAINDQKLQQERNLIPDRIGIVQAITNVFQLVVLNCGSFQVLLDRKDNNADVNIGSLSIVNTLQPKDVIFLYGPFSVRIFLVSLN